MEQQAIFKSPAGEQKLMALYEKVLASWPVAAEQLFVETSLGSVFVMASGAPQAPPMILLHGSGSNAATWAGDVALYSREFRVYAVDIPGEAGKSARRRADWNGDGYTLWLEELYRGLGLQQAVLAGLSLGGWIACRFALDRPALVSGLVLICPSGIYPARSSFMLKMFFLSLLGRWGQTRIKALIFRGQQITPEAEEFFELINRHFNYRMGEPPLFSDAELSILTIPLLYLGGQEDVLLNTRKSSARLRALVPGAEIKVIPGRGQGPRDTEPTPDPPRHGAALRPSPTQSA